MKKILLIVLPLLLIVGCNKPEPKFYEKGGKTYFVDNKGEVYIIDGTSKIKIEDYVEPSFDDKKIYEDEITWGDLNIKYTVTLKYFSSKLKYRIFMSDIDGKEIGETDWFNRITSHSSYSEPFILSPRTGDNFPILNIEFGQDYTRINDDGKILKLRYEGSKILSKEEFNLIGRVSIQTRL